MRKHGWLHRLHMAQSSCRGAKRFPDIDIGNFSMFNQVFPNSCFLFSSCINKESSYGCFSGGRHCRRVPLWEWFFYSQFFADVGTLQFNSDQNQCHRCSQDHACDAHWTAFVGFGDNIRYKGRPHLSRCGIFTVKTPISYLQFC